MYFYIPIFSFFLLNNNVSLSAIVVSQVFYSIFVFLGEVPTGLLADRLGQKFSIALGYLLEAFGVAFILFFPTTLGLYICYSIRGLASSFLSGSEEALLYESVKRAGRTDFQKIYGRFLSNEHIGFMISAALAGGIYHLWQDTSFVPLIILTSFCLFGATFASVFLTDFKAKIINEAASSHMFSILKESFSLIRRNKTIFTLTVVSALTISGEYIVQGIYQPHFAANAVPGFWVGLALSIGLLVNTIAMRYVYILEKYLSLEKILLLFILTLGVSYIFFGISNQPLILVGLYIFMNGLFNLHAPVVSDYINSRTKSHIRTTVLSGISFIRRFFQVFLTWGLGAAVGLWGIEISLVIQGLYLIIGIGIGYYLLVRCGCTYKVANSEGEELKFT